MSPLLERPQLIKKVAAPDPNTHALPQKNSRNKSNGFKAGVTEKGITITA